MGNELTKKYNLITAIAAVVGIVIGSGVFFKAQPILIATWGDLPLGIWAWIIGGLVMLACIIMFSRLAGKYEKVNGVVDYAENTCGKGFAYYIGRFVATIYLPCITSVLAWVTARYFSVLFDRSITGGECMCLAGFILIACFVRNALAPKLAGKIQVATMIIKLIPILGMAIVGTIYGLMTGMTVENFTHVASEALGGTTGSLLKAVVATAFAYEGWICVTSLNSEIKNSKRNLPIALISGAILIIVVYVLYYIGVAGGATNQVLMEEGATTAFTNIFGTIGGTILNALVVVSCLGTLNGLTMGISRCMYSLAVRNQGPNPQLFKQVDPVSNMPLASTFIQMLITAIWLVYFYGANLTEGRFWLFNFDSSELPIVTLYGMYIPIFIGYMMKEKSENAFWRCFMPIVAIIACGFMVFAAIYAHGIMPYEASIEAGTGFSCPVLFYLVVFAVIMFIGAMFKNHKNSMEDLEETE